MNSNNFLQLAQQGLRVTLGATTSLVETLQDNQKRQEAVAQLSTELSQKVQEWAEKGEITEQEARRLLENFWNQQSKQTYSAQNTTATESTTAAATTVNSNTQGEIQELTAQITALRAELEKLRDSGANN